MCQSRVRQACSLHDGDDTYLILATSPLPGAVLTALAVLLNRDRAGVGWIVAGLVLYIAVLVVTFAVNVPLNNRLDAATGDPTAARAAFESAWVAWNHVRSLLCTAALASLCWALVLHGRLTG